MPELPEVENARRCLIKAELPGRAFTKADIGWAKTVKTPDLEEFALGLRGGVVQDYVQAHKWVNLATSRQTGEWQQISSARLLSLARLMTPAQIAEAQQLAREWNEAHPPE